MKLLFYSLMLSMLIYGCSAGRERNMNDTEAAYAQDTVSDTVRIANDSLEYEILIIDPGYSYFLNAVARPEGFHSLSYLENKNRFLVNDYNQRVMQPTRYNPNLYTMTINYDPNIDYGYEVNYKLYNYFVYLSERFNQRFSVPAHL